MHERVCYATINFVYAVAVPLDQEGMPGHSVAELQGLQRISQEKQIRRSNKKIIFKKIEKKSKSEDNIVTDYFGRGI